MFQRAFKFSNKMSMLALPTRLSQKSLIYPTSICLPKLRNLREYVIFIYSFKPKGITLLQWFPTKWFLPTIMYDLSFQKEKTVIYHLYLFNHQSNSLILVHLSTCHHQVLNAKKLRCVTQEKIQNHRKENDTATS